MAFFSLLAARNKNIKDVFSFEPDVQTLPYLIANIQRNRASNIAVLPYAVSSGPKTQKLFLQSGHSGASSIKDWSLSTSFREIDCVNELFLNNYFDFGTNLEVFVKIDVEGHELDVLTFLKNWNKFNQVSFIFLEFDIYLSDTNKLTSVLEEFGFMFLSREGSDTHWDELWQGYSDC